MAAPRSERGAATAELVMMLPALAVLTLALVWLLGLSAAQVRLVDAAREAARAAARGDDASSAVSVGVRVGPAGTSVTLSPGDSTIVATAVARVDGPGGLFGFLPGVRLHASATALLEGASP